MHCFDGLSGVVETPVDGASFHRLDVVSLGVGEVYGDDTVPDR